MKKWGIFSLFLIVVLGVSGYAGYNKSIKHNKKNTVTSQPTETVLPTQTVKEQVKKVEKAKATYTPIILKTKIKDFGAIVVAGDSGYELYNYSKSSAVLYASIVKKTAANLKGKSNVYDVIIPTSIGITMPDNLVSKVNSSNQESSIKQIYSYMDKNVITVNLYDTLMKHRTEYIYFKTDHHWTAKGAFYSYEKICEKAGLTSADLDEYDTDVFKGFKGSFCIDTKYYKKLKTDTLKVYYPLKSNKISMKYTNSDGVNVKWPLISDAKNYGATLKYCTFIGGDNPITYIKNKAVKNKKVCIVVKESFGNAIAPFLADNYSEMYVVDYRYWKGSISKLSKQKKAEDVFFINNISMTRNNYLLGQLAKIE